MGNGEILSAINSIEETDRKDYNKLKEKLNDDIIKKSQIELNTLKKAVDPIVKNPEGRRKEGNATNAAFTKGILDVLTHDLKIQNQEINGIKNKLGIRSESGKKINEIENLAQPNQNILESDFGKIMKVSFEELRNKSIEFANLGPVDGIKTDEQLLITAIQYQIIKSQGKTDMGKADGFEIGENTLRSIFKDLVDIKNTDEILENFEKRNNEAVDELKSKGYNIVVEGDNVVIENDKVKIETSKNSELYLSKTKDIVLIHEDNSKKYKKLDITKGTVEEFDIPVGKTWEDVKNDKEKEEVQEINQEKEPELGVNENKKVDGKLSIDGNRKIEMNYEQIMRDLIGFKRDGSKDEEKGTLKSDITKHLSDDKVGNISNYSDLYDARQGRKNNFRVGLDMRISDLKEMKQKSKALFNDPELEKPIEDKIKEYENLIKQFDLWQEEQDKKNADQKFEKKNTNENPDLNYERIMNDLQGFGMNINKGYKMTDSEKNALKQDIKTYLSTIDVSKSDGKFITESYPKKNSIIAGLKMEKSGLKKMEKRASSVLEDKEISKLLEDKKVLLEKKIDEYEKLAE